MKIFKVALVSILAAGALYAGSYKVDLDHSNVGFKVKHMLISNVKGNFTDFSGNFFYDEKTKSLKEFTGIVKVSSIDTDNKKRDDHLKSEDFFNATKFPTMTFKLSKVLKDKVQGTLTIHGITKDVIFDYENNGAIKDPWGNTRVGLSLSGKISRSQYGLKWNKLLEAGGAVVADKIKLEIDIEGILKK